MVRWEKVVDDVAHSDYADDRDGGSAVHLAKKRDFDRADAHGPSADGNTSTV